MASHLTVISTASGVATSKGLNGQSGPADRSDPGNAFAALLGAADKSAAPVASAETKSGIGNQASAGFAAGDQQDELDNPDAIAAVLDVALPIQTPPALAELVDGLADLKASLEAGTGLDPELLKRIDAALEALAAQLDIDLTAQPDLADLKAMLANAKSADAGLGAELANALAPLAETLMANADAETLTKSVGEKLAAMLQALTGKNDLAADQALKAAMVKLAASPAKVETSVEAQVLGTPELKLTEPTLTGKSDDASGTKPADSGLGPVDAASHKPSADTGDNEDKTKDKPVDAKAAPAVAADADRPLPDPQASMLSTQQASRIDAAAARPVIQAGYQTSQQQLNLPQLAFELVRQVNDGNTRFQMRLDPPELGKIHVKLDIDPTGQVNARLTVEKAETLDLMQRDQRALERALQQAGLDSSKTNLEFSLTQNPFSGNQQGQDGNGGRGAQAIAADEVDELPPPTVNLYRGRLSASGVNIIA